MRNYGRRLKRYFLLKREKLDLFGGVESIFPSKIVGWIYSENVNLQELRLYIGNHLISKSSINIYRKDVNNKYKFNGNLGFELPILEDIPEIDLKQEIKIIAYNNTNLINFEIKPIFNNKRFKKDLEKIFKSNIKGTMGHFDGLNDSSQYIGWAAKPNNEEILSVWLQCKDKKPIEVICSEHRNDLTNASVKLNSGFKFSSNRIPTDWEGKIITCSFDEKGDFKLPQLQEFKVEKSQDKIFENQDLFIKEDLEQELKADIQIPSNFQEHWEALEDFNLTLKKIEFDLNQNYKNSFIKNKKNFFSKILKK